MPEFAISQKELSDWQASTAKQTEAQAVLKPLKEKILAGNNRQNVEPGDLVLMVTMDPGSSVAYKKAIDALIEKHPELKAEAEELVKANTKPAPKPHIQVEARASAE
jgi:hypothetical protein